MTSTQISPTTDCAIGRPSSLERGENLVADRNDDQEHGEDDDRPHHDPAKVRHPRPQEKCADDQGNEGKDARIGEHARIVDRGNISPLDKASRFGWQFREAEPSRPSHHLRV